MHAVPEHALAVIGSHAIPQPPQLSKLPSERPSTPEATMRFRQLVPQQRCVEGHEGMHADGGPRSSPGTEPSAPGTHALARQSMPETQRLPQPPQLFGSVVTGTQLLVPSPFGHERSKVDMHTDIGTRSSPQPVTSRAKIEPTARAKPCTR